MQNQIKIGNSKRIPQRRLIRENPNQKQDTLAFQSDEDEDSDNQETRDGLANDLVNYMAPANELIPKIQDESFSLYTAFRTYLEDLPQFNISGNFEFEDPLKKLAKKSNKSEIPENSLTEKHHQPTTLMDYHQKNKIKMVYKRYSELDPENPAKIGDNYYFATYITKLDSFGVLPEKRLNSQKDNSFFPCKQWPSTLQFDSKFESGNLLLAYQQDENRYDLILQNDINTRGNTQWFFFKVKGVKKGQKVQFSMINLLKQGSLFNDGLCPVVYSKKQEQLSQRGWVREGQDISYFKNTILKEGQPVPQSGQILTQQSQNFYYTLTFSYTFSYDDDEVYFAHSFPYTFSQLSDFMASLQTIPDIQKILSKKVLCKTLIGNNCDVITITSHSTLNRNLRKGIVLMARQHPGESVGSYIMEGIIRFLVSDSPIAAALREMAIFKLVPMVNIDGVIHGNYRTSLIGCDLNRRWKNPKSHLHPVIHEIKQMIKRLKRDRDIKFIIDLHGHSRKLNAFFYGCTSKEDPYTSRLFPYMMTKINKQVSFKDCRFTQTKCRERTARVALWKDFQIPNVFTLEASFMGYVDEKNERRHFKISDLLKMGEDLCVSMYRMLKQDRAFRNLNLEDPTGNLQEKDEVDDLFNELREQKDLIQLQDGFENSGSDTNPSQDELDDQELCQILPQNLLSKNQQKIRQEQDEKRKARLAEPKLLRPPQREEKSKEISSPVKPRIQISSQKSEKKEAEPPKMVDKCIQTDTSFLQEYRNFLLKKQKMIEDQQVLLPNSNAHVKYFQQQQHAHLQDPNSIKRQAQVLANLNKDYITNKTILNKNIQYFMGDPKNPRNGIQQILNGQKQIRVDNSANQIINQPVTTDRNDLLKRFNSSQMKNENQQEVNEGDQKNPSMVNRIKKRTISHENSNLRSSNIQNSLTQSLVYPQQNGRDISSANSSSQNNGQTPRSRRTQRGLSPGIKINQSLIQTQQYQGKHDYTQRSNFKNNQINRSNIDSGSANQKTPIPGNQQHQPQQSPMIMYQDNQPNSSLNFQSSSISTSQNNLKGKVSNLNVKTLSMRRQK